jgi:hypothetical protein
VSYILFIKPDYLTHYYESARGPFKTLSDLQTKDAERLQCELWKDDKVFASKRDESYLRTRLELEGLVREQFVQRGGRPVRKNPFTMVLGSCEWFYAWYRETREIRIPIASFDENTVSFTYGDMFPAMRMRDGKPYRGKVYLIEELEALVRQYGLPQKNNPQGERGPDRYIEAQVWSDEPIGALIREYNRTNGARKA